MKRSKTSLLRYFTVFHYNPEPKSLKSWTPFKKKTTFLQALDTQLFYSHQFCSLASVANLASVAKTEGVVRCSANYVPLSPISFLERAAVVYRDRPSVIYGNVHYTWGQTLERCTQLASALSLLGISSGDVKPKDELQPISLNYTSGTTSSPKGVVYSHRGAYLNSLATVMLNEMSSITVYLWTVPMFHCNGWCLTWGLAARGGTNICLRNVTANGIFSNIAEHKVTHMGGAPTVLSMMINARADQKKPLPGKVAVMIGAAPPPSQVLFKMEEMGLVAIHAYGLTETYGPGTFCAWKPEWNALPPHEQAKMKARQGVHHIGMEEVDVKHPVTMESAPSDGRTMGEVMFRGNTVMSGYLNDLKASKEAFQGGWFHTGDLGVKHPDGYIELKDRAKDIIISGGENISTIEVESVIFNHPAVVDAAVVGRPDDHWGETPCAFIELKSSHSHVSAEDMITFCRDHLPRYMVPRTVVFEKLPKTSTGKTQKFVLKEKAKAMGSLSCSNASKI
ncbi:butanoate--CoA ligase AAE1-like isoform X2 [Silene latifolia]|uniref:butanoate--CoA ligase AAE1-like isoform X2 n=1 Tax=Silene latifolia TaxID=37657 RepID=UPI003D7720B7